MEKRTKLLNSELLGDEKDRQLAGLKLTIKKFKQYDKERKEYCHKLEETVIEQQSRIDELEQEVKELREKETTTLIPSKIDGNQETIENLKNLIKNKNEIIRKQGIVISAKNLTFDLTEEELEDLRKMIKANNQKTQINSLKKKVRDQKNMISRLIYRLGLEKNNQ